MTARSTLGALGLSLALGTTLATATACSTDTVDVGTGDTSGATTTSATAGGTMPGSSLDPSTSISLPENCREVPATTGPGGAAAGGGEIVCTEQPGVVPGSPGDPDAPVSTDASGAAPAPVTTTTFAPDDTHGVLQGTAVGGIDCAPDEACIAMAVIMDGTVTLTTLTPDGGGQATTAAIDGNGTWGARVAPGIYVITVQPSRGECDPQTATVEPGLVTEVNLTCVAPLS